MRSKINIVSLAITILFGLLAVYFWWDGKKKKEISYFTIDTPSLVFSHKNAYGLTLYEKDSLLINQDVYLIQGVIWNSGDFTITKEDIRKPLKISLLNSERILDYNISHQEVSDIPQFTLEKANDNSLLINWKYFDPNYGFKFQIVFIGNESTTLNVNGNVALTQIKQITINPKQIEEDNELKMILILFIPLTILLWCGHLFFNPQKMTRLFLKKQSTSKSMTIIRRLNYALIIKGFKPLLFLYTIVTVGMIAYFVFGIITNRFVEPPIY